MPRRKEPVFDDDNPEWTKEDFQKALKVAPGVSLLDATKMLRGRPKLENPKQAVSLRLDQDVLTAYRKLGPGWQSQINSDLRKARKLKA